MSLATYPHPHQWEYGRILYDYRERLAVIGYLCVECFAELNDTQPMLYPENPPCPHDLELDFSDARSNGAHAVRLGYRWRCPVRSCNAYEDTGLHIEPPSPHTLTDAEYHKLAVVPIEVVYK